MRYFKIKNLLKISIISILLVMCVGSIYATDNADINSINPHDSIIYDLDDVLYEIDDSDLDEFDDSDLDLDDDLDEFDDSDLDLDDDLDE
ncbi:hypothetical protein, partial [uncultured Methanobrevibacter sp.]|uniref:hypothetical protein n=1 Tax=uncultured Methanobrevibacter sp. TaxID=253161 RepID=UPI0025CE2A65